MRGIRFDAETPRRGEKLVIFSAPLRLCVTILVCALATFAASPAITELRPRGAEIGRPFTLTIVGRSLGDEARITTTLPGAFTPVLPPATPMQTPAGTWDAFESRRPPMNSGVYQTTALAVYTLKTYGPPAEKADTEKALARAAAWLEAARPATTPGPAARSPLPPAAQVRHQSSRPPSWPGRRRVPGALAALGRL